MLELSFTARDLARTRFAFSPLWEVVASVRTLRDPGPHSLHTPWIEQVRPQLAASDVDWQPLFDLVPDRLIPGFLAPPPSTPVADLAVELAAVRSSSAAQVRKSLDLLDRPLSRRLELLRDDPERYLGWICSLIHDYWDVAVAPYWPRIHAVARGDVLYRARLLAEGGADRLFADLDPSIEWDEANTLKVAHRTISGARQLRGQGLLLVPSVFAWPRVFSITAPPWQPTLRYPPRGAATVWERQERDVPAALSAVIGRTRARLLVELEVPASTTDLAERTGISAGGVSQHLTALRKAGFVQSHRTGRFVLYARAEIAQRLLSQ